MMKKKLLSLILAGVLAIGATACSSPESTQATASEGEGSGEKVKLTIATFSDPFEVDIVTEQAQAYMDANPDVELVIEPISGDIWEVLKTRMAANEEPDIFYMDIFQSAQFMDAGKLAPLNDALSDEDKADFDEALLNGFTGADGNLYGVPKDYSTLALYYNTQMLADAGIEPPTTWDELESAAAALTDEDAGIYGLVLQNELPRAQPFFYSAGGSMMVDGVPTLNTPENIEAYQFFIDLINNKYAQTPQQMGLGWSGDAFATGTVAMAVEGTWMVNSLLEMAPDLEYGVVPIPQKDEPASMQFTVAYSMSNNTEHPEVAKDVISFLTSTEQQLVVANAGRSMPARKSALETYVENWPERQVFVDVTPVASEFNYGVVSPTVVTEAAKAMEKVLLEGVSVEEAFNEAQAVIDQALEDAK